MPLALLALTLAAFAIGTTEFVIVGLIPTIAGDLHVSLPSAGLLVSVYALAVAIGAPILSTLTGGLPRKILLIGLMGLFTFGNLLAWLAPGYASLVMARILTGLAHGVFFSVGSVVASRLVPREKAARAMATMFSGMTVAFVLGIPLGTWIGQHFGWHASFLVVAVFGLIALLGAMALVPADIEQTPAAPWHRQWRVLLKPDLLRVYAMTAIGYGGSLIAFTYLAPILQRMAGFAPEQLGPVLMAYGISVAVGNLWGGRLTDRHGPITALAILFGLLSLVLMLLGLTMHSKPLLVLTVLAWGAVAFGNVPALQVLVLRQAERTAPDAIDIAAGFNISAFNLGVAGGAWIGAETVTRIGLAATPWIAAAFTLIALAVTGWSARRDRLPPRITG